MVVVYAGDNDLADGTGKDVDRVVADYREHVATSLLDAKGVPRDDVFLFDGLHLNDTGFAVGTEMVAPVLHAAAG